MVTYAGDRMVKSLSARLLVLTVVFVMLAEGLIMFMSVPQFRREWLTERLWYSQIATLAAEADDGDVLSPTLERELLDNAMVEGVRLRRPDGRVLLLGTYDRTGVAATYDLQDDSPWGQAVGAWRTFLLGSRGRVEVVGAPRMDGGTSIGIIMDEAPLRAAMLHRMGTLLVVSLLISLITAGLIYITLFRLFVRPMKDLATNMARFADAPEDARRVMPASRRRDEIGALERILHDMEEQVRTALAQKARLASLGEAVAKVNHDLRNILATARLVSNRLSQSDDPSVRTISSTLIRAIDRAIGICSDTLTFGRPQAPTPRIIRFELRPIVEEAGQGLGLSDQTSPMFLNNVDPQFELDADPEHIFRALQNLIRNAADALGGRLGEIVVAAGDDGETVYIEVADTGPGLSQEARRNLFKPFKGSTHADGAGLGLVNVREIVHAHGGEVSLQASGAGGTTFRLTLPKTETPAAIHAVG